VAEWKLFEGDVPYVSTAQFHADRERVPHVDQPHHRPRLDKAAELVAEAALQQGGSVTVSDLGCGDGGLLSLLAQMPHLDCWGYDFQPSNAAGWFERGVTAYPLDAFGTERASVVLGDISVVTEVLEHLADPHDAVRWIGKYSPWIVASSPWAERLGRHDECHAWAWDLAGYQALIRQGGYEIAAHDRIGPFQLILGRRPA
jgi:hypothetical protein